MTKPLAILGHNALSRFQGLKANRPNYYENLQPGASDADLDAFEARFQLKLPADSRALYKWHDGQKPDYYKRLVDNYNFLSLSRVASAKKSQDSMIGEIFETPEWWQSEWIPFSKTAAGTTSSWI